MNDVFKYSNCYNIIIFLFGFSEFLSSPLFFCEPGIAITQESPMFLDPSNEDDAALIGFNSLGQPEPCREPAVDLNHWDKLRIEFSIEHYGLNDRELCEQRKALWVAISAMFDEYAKF